MPITPNEINIQDLDPLSNPADLVSRYLEVADATGKNNKVSFPTMAQVVADTIPGGNNAKNHYKLARTYDTLTPGYVTGFPTLVDLNQNFLAGGAVCWVEFPHPSREYRLMYNPNGPVNAFTSGEFVGQKLNYSWVEKTEADQLTAGFAAFDPFKTPKYAQGDTVKFTIGGITRLFEARQDLVLATYTPTRIPAPTGAGTDPNWNELSVQPAPNDSTGGQITCRFRFDAESQADPYGGDTLEAVARRNPYLYVNRMATVELGPHAGTYRVAYDGSGSPEFEGYVDGSFTVGKLPCKWELVPAGGSGGVVNLAGVTENVGGFHAGESFQGDLQAFATKLLVTYQAPGFFGFSFDDGGSRAVLAGTRFSGGLHSFGWGTNNSANVQPSSITIADSTLGTTLVVSTDNDGYQSLVVPTFTLLSGQSKTFTIAGLDSGGSGFSTSLTLTGTLARFYGASSLTPNDLMGQLQNGQPINLATLGLATDLGNSIVNNITADCSGGKYVYFLYSANLPNPTQVRAGLNAFSAYTVASVQLTDQLGNPQAYKVLYTGIQYGSAVNFNVVS